MKMRTTMTSTTMSTARVSTKKANTKKANTKSPGMKTADMKTQNLRKRPTAGRTRKPPKKNRGRGWTCEGSAETADPDLCWLR